GAGGAARVRGALAARRAARGRRASRRGGPDPLRRVRARRRRRARRRAAARAAAVRRGRRARGDRVVGGGDGADRAGAVVPRPRPARALPRRVPRRGPGLAHRVRAAAARAQAPAHRRRTAPGGAGRPRRTGPLRGARRRGATRPRRRRRPAAGRAHHRHRRPHRRAHMSRLAINRLKERKPDAAAVDRFLARHDVPIVEGDRCTFLWRGEADEVFLVQRIVGLPERLPLRRLWGTDLWYLVLELPPGSRINYQIEVRRGDRVERGNDPLNPKVSYSPVGTSSVCFAHGYTTPDWTEPDPDARPGELTELVLPSRALRRDCRVTVYLPARLRRTAAYPLLVVHDGGDFLQYAAAKTVLDNLIHRLDVAETVVAFVDPGDRLAEYADSTAHARFLTRELVPRLEADLPLVAQ